VHKVLLSVIALLTSSTLLTAAPRAAKQPPPGRQDAQRRGLDHLEVPGGCRGLQEGARLCGEPFPASSRPPNSSGKAVELDPDFALGHALPWSADAGAEGLKEIERGAALAKGLPEGERMLIEIRLADARGEEEKVRELWNSSP